MTSLTGAVDPPDSDLASTTQATRRTRAGSPTSAADHELRRARRAVACGKWNAFVAESHRLAALAARGAVDRIAAIDGLQDIADANSLIDVHSADAVQAALAAAFAGRAP